MRLANQRAWMSTALCALVLLVAGAGSAAAQTSTISGRITAKENNAPLGDVRVVIVTSNNFAVTKGDGPVSQADAR